MKLIFTIAQHQLAVSFNRKRGRPAKPFLNRFQNFAFYLLKQAKDKRLHGHPASRVLRRVFENKKIKKVLGFNLTALILLTSIVSPAQSALQSQPQAEVTLVVNQKVETTTKQSVRIPLDTFNITQRYHLFHRGIDLKETIGAPVYPIMGGVVEEVAYTHFGYGNYVIVNHGSSYKSLYAHLSKIIVEKNQEVDQNTVIGL
ncbi:unnamed protein product, partial [marine sediment metagenome]